LRVSSPNRHGNAPMVKVKMGADRQIATLKPCRCGLPRDVEQGNAYVHVCIQYTSRSPYIPLQQTVTCQLDNVHTRVLGACPTVLETCISSYPLSIIGQPAHQDWTKRRRPATTLPAVPNDNNNRMLSSGQTVVAWTHVIVNPPIAIKRKRTGVCRSAGKQKQAKVIL